MDPHVPDDHVAEQPGADPAPARVAAGPEADDQARHRQQEHDLAAGDDLGPPGTVDGSPWTTADGRPAVPWRIFFDTGTAAMDLAYELADLCRDRGGVSAEIKAVDEYDGAPDLIDVPGVVLVFSSDPPGSLQPSNPATLARIARDFRDSRRLPAIDGFYPGSDRWHRVGVLTVRYTDHALDDPVLREIIGKACAPHPYTPGQPFTGDLFEVFQPGKARLVRENDQLAVANDIVWKRLRRWGVNDIEQARTIRWEIDTELDTLENRNKRAMYRPIPGNDHNQLWLVLHDPTPVPPTTRTRPPRRTPMRRRSSSPTAGERSGTSSTAWNRSTTGSASPKASSVAAPSDTSPTSTMPFE